jgi:uncharacterized protein (DUF2236 family)
MQEAPMALTDPFRRLGTMVTGVGGQLAQPPLRILGSLAEPVRADIRRDVRRTLGVTRRPSPPPTDPAVSFLDPDGVARRVHADLPSMVIGGMSALFLQALHPRAMAGVADHSGYAEDPIGRMQRTAAFVATTTYGTVEEAQAAVEQVRRVHRRVRGTAPDGTSYSADDADLVTWIHVAEMSSLLHSAQRFGPRRFTAEECDRFYEETSVVAHALGAEWVPTSVDEVAAYLRRVRGELYAGSQALGARDFLLRGVARRPEDRAVYTVIAAAAVSLLPRWARAELRIPHPPLVDRAAVVPLARALCAGLRWAVGSPQVARVSPPSTATT